jgi:hypothetical protein
MSKTLIHALVDSTRSIAEQSKEIEGLRVEQRAGFASLKSSQDVGFRELREAIQAGNAANAKRDSSLRSLSETHHASNQEQLGTMNSTLDGLSTIEQQLLELARKRSQREEADRARRLRLDDEDRAEARTLRAQNAELDFEQKKVRAQIRTRLLKQVAKWVAGILALLATALTTWLSMR